MKKKVIPYGKQIISQSDIDAVVAVLESDWLTQGPKVPEFEHAIAEYCTVKYASATNSATSALHLACLALDVGEGDIIWTSPISFVASSNCALYCGANVDFVDIDLETGNMSIAALENKLIQAQKQKSLPKVVIPVHLAGQPCDMAAINSLAKKYSFQVIEDASHAIGAKYKDKPVGSCDYSDITVFSFHPVKIITSAEGGVAVTNSQKLDNKIKRLRSHGVTANPAEMTEPSHGPWYYQQLELGFNYRMTELQAALGLNQLKQLDNFVATRNKLAQAYTSSIDNSNIEHLTQSSNSYSSYHLYIIRLINSAPAKHKQIISGLREQGIIAHLHYIPIHLQPYYQKLGFTNGDFPNAETYYNQAITLPLHPAMDEQDLCYILDSLQSLL